MKNYGKVTTTNIIILTTVTIVLIGAFDCAISILQQNANATTSPPRYIPYDTSPSDVNSNPPDHQQPPTNHFAWGPSDVPHTNDTR
jgi:hypothetical protein